MGPRKQVRAAESRRTIGRGMWAFLFGIFASFGVGFWLMSATLALARFFVYSDPPGVGDASRLRRIYVTRSGSAPYQVMPVLSASEVSSLRTALGDLRVEAYSERVSRLELGNLRQSVRSVEATAGLLSLLHVRLQLGNNDPAESDDQPYAVISDRLWRQAFQGSTSALGTAIRIDGRPYRVSGILPAGFDGLDRQRVDVWTLSPTSVRQRSNVHSDAYFLSGVVRFSEGANAERASAILAATLHNAPTGMRPITSVRLAPLSHDRFGNDAVRRAAPYALSLAAAVLMLALGTCALVVANRFHELLPSLRIRSAIGASPTRLIAAFGAAPVAMLGVTATVVLVSLPSTLVLLGVLQPGMTRPVDALTRIASVVVVCVSISLLLLICARVERRYLRVAGPIMLLKRRDARARRFLAGCYLTVTVALVVCAVPIAIAYGRVLATDTGFAPRDATAIRADIADSAGTPSQRHQAMHNILDEMRAMPGVTAVAASTSVPFGILTSGLVTQGSQNGPGVPASVYLVAGDLIEALGLHLTNGDVSALQHFSATSAVINEALAARLEGSPLGSCVFFLDDACNLVAAVVQNTSVIALGDRSRAVLYAPLSESRATWRQLYFIVRTRGALANATKRALETLVERHLPGSLAKATPFSDALRQQAAPLRRFATLNVILLIVSLALTVIGLRAIVVLSMQERRIEMGVRAALGASPVVIAWASLREFTTVGVASAFAGLGMGLLAIRLLGSQLQALSIPSLAGQLAACIAVPMLLVATAALPVWRAARAQPAMFFREVSL